MLTTLVALHCTVAGIAGTYLFLVDRFSASYGSATGWGGKKTPLWEIGLKAAFWEVTLGLELVGLAKDKITEALSK